MYVIPEKWFPEKSFPGISFRGMYHIQEHQFPVCIVFRKLGILVFFIVFSLWKSDSVMKNLENCQIRIKSKSYSTGSSVVNNSIIWRIYFQGRVSPCKARPKTFLALWGFWKEWIRLKECYKITMKPEILLGRNFQENILVR